jgi:hypothetical protein
MGLAKETMIAEVEAFIAELRKSQKDKMMTRVYARETSKI